MANQAWNLESFLDALIVELDRARETLAVKAINKPLTYTVKDMNLEMQLFPSFDGKQIKFISAEPGQTGASKIAIQLGSITDQQIRQTTKNPISRDDIKIDTIGEIDDDTKQNLRKIGVTSVNDLAEIEKKNVDIEKVGNRQINYEKLANLLKKAKRGYNPPAINRATMSLVEEVPILKIEGKNLAVDKNYEPVAVFNGQLAEVLTSNKSSLTIKVLPDKLKKGGNVLVMALDPFTVFKLDINTNNL